MKRLIVALSAVAILGIGALAAVDVGCGGSQLTVDDGAMLGSEADQDTTCVINNRGNRAKTDACRASIKAFFDTYWAEVFDGGKDAQHDSR